MKRAYRFAPIMIPIVAAGVVPGILVAHRRLRTPGGFGDPTTSGPALAARLPGAALLCIGAVLVGDSVDRVYLRQATPLGDAPPEALVVDGAYSINRNPMATGMVLALVGEALVTRTWSIIGWGAAVATVSALTTWRLEEPSLHQAFGARYASYAKHTGRLVPRGLATGGILGWRSA